MNITCSPHLNASAYKFEESTEIIGLMKLRLWVEARSHDNMDMFVWIKKLDEDGKEIPIHSMGEPYRDAWGYLRAKRRELDPKMHFITDNGEGKHVIHTGGEHESYLQIPVIPPRYKCGDYVYR